MSLGLRSTLDTSGPTPTSPLSPASHKYGVTPKRHPLSDGEPRVVHCECALALNRVLRQTLINAQTTNRLRQPTRPCERNTSPPPRRPFVVGDGQTISKARVSLS